MVCVSVFQEIDMRKHLLPIALATLAVSALAGAQTQPNSQSPPSSSSSAPPTSMQAPSATTGPSSYSTGSSDSKAQWKDCMAKQKASNPQTSEADMKRACAKGAQ
jgi:hypothetical protein